MRDLELYRQYLVRVRQHYLHQGHQFSLGADKLEDLLNIKACAGRADLCDLLLRTMGELEQSPEGFIKRYLT